MQRFPASSEVTAPAAFCVSVSEAKFQLGIADEIDYYDRQLKEMIEEATHKLEGDTGRKFVTQTLDILFEGFPRGPRWRYLPIPYPPLQSVTSVTYNDADSASQTLAAGQYTVRVNREPGEILLKHGNSWPTTDHEGEAVTVRAVVGYGLASAVPIEAKNAIKRLVNLLFTNRSGEMESDGLYKSLVDSLRFGEEWECYDRSYEPQTVGLWHY